MVGGGGQFDPLPFQNFLISSTSYNNLDVQSSINKKYFRSLAEIVKYLCAQGCFVFHNNDIIYTLIYFYYLVVCIVFTKRLF